MISRDVIRRVNAQTCAVGVLKVPVEEYIAKPDTLSFKICGTGFLVAPRIVLTNRHVVDGVESYAREHQFPSDRRYVAFLQPAGTGMNQTFRRFVRVGMVAPPSELDLGLIEFRGDDNDPLDTIVPAHVPKACVATPGDPVAVLGYAFGESLLRRGSEEVVYRFGALLQQGYISAMAPYDHSGIVHRFLLDVRTARGMSGAPVFDPQTGSVLAVHSAGIDATVAFAIPVVRSTVDDMLRALSTGTVGVRNEVTLSTVLRPDEDAERQRTRASREPPA